MKKCFRVSWYALAVVVALSCACFAQDIRSRMIERLPAIKELKMKGLVGENNAGFLEILGGAKDGEALVQAENADRKAVYEAIARREGVSVEIVGQRRALQISQTAETGEFIQDAQGAWYKK